MDFDWIFMYFICFLLFVSFGLIYFKDFVRFNEILRAFMTARILVFLYYSLLLRRFTYNSSVVECGIIRVLITIIGMEKRSMVCHAFSSQ